MKEPTDHRCRAGWQAELRRGPETGTAARVAEGLWHPSCSGDGVRFFARKAGERVELETIAVSRAEHLTNLRFRV